MSTQLFINAHIATGMPGSTAAETAAIQDILVEDGKFISIAPHLKATLEAQGKDMTSVEVVDLGGKLVCPPFCDTHLHLDYVFTARKPGAVNESGTLFEGIQRWSETKADLTVDEIKERAKIGIAKEMRHGVQFIRSHADVTDPNLTSLKALLELKEELKDTVTLQIVSFPQEGMYSYEGPHGESGADLVEEGLKIKKAPEPRCSYFMTYIVPPAAANGSILRILSPRITPSTHSISSAAAVPTSRRSRTQTFYTYSSSSPSSSRSSDVQPT